MGKGWICAIVCILLVATGCTDSSAEKPAAATTYASYEEAILGEAQARGISLTEEELSSTGRMAEEDAAEYLSAGVTLTEEQQDDLLQAYQVEALAAKLRDLLVKNISVSDTDVRNWYDERLASLEKAFAEDPGLFKGQQEGYELYGGVPPLVVPDGYMHVKHILVEDEATAEEALSRLNAGEDFDKLLVEYGTDPGMKAEPYQTVGYLVGAYESSRDYLEEFKQAALSLTHAGDISGIVKTRAGYHIIKLIDRVQPKIVSYEETAGVIRELLEKQARQAAFDEMGKSWDTQG
jgi:foldase protein PrsA